MQRPGHGLLEFIQIARISMQKFLVQNIRYKKLQLYRQLYNSEVEQQQRNGLLCITAVPVWDLYEH
jgi:hypothetical protein